VGCAGDEVYRLDLAEGRFKAPLPLPTKGFGVNQLEVVGSGLFVQGQGARREEHPMWFLLLFSRVDISWLLSHGRVALTPLPLSSYPNRVIRKPLLAPRAKFMRLSNLGLHNGVSQTTPLRRRPSLFLLLPLSPIRQPQFPGVRCKARLRERRMGHTPGGNFCYLFTFFSCHHLALPQQPKHELPIYPLLFPFFTLFVSRWHHFESPPLSCF
jgi:hypothetical protein